MNKAFTLIELLVVVAIIGILAAVGTLKWVKDGGFTGTGRDHNDKKVKFTVSKNS